jgi:hypothetical protein
VENRFNNCDTGSAKWVTNRHNIGNRSELLAKTAPLIFTIGGSDKLNLNPFKDYQGALPFYVWKA